MIQQERFVLAIFLATLMLLSPIAGVAGAGTAGTQTSSTGDIVEINDGVSVWEGAVLPFRAETTAETTVSAIPGLAAESDGQMASLNRDAISVYDTGDPVTFSYKTNDLSTSGFADDDVKILVGYLDEDIDQDDGSLSDLPMTSDSLMEELSQDNLDDLNNNVTFSLEDETLDSDGELDEFSYTPSDPGFYTFVMVQDDDDALSVSGGDVEIDPVPDEVDEDGINDLEDELRSTLEDDLEDEDEDTIEDELDKIGFSDEQIDDFLDENEVLEIDEDDVSDLDWDYLEDEYGIVLSEYIELKTITVIGLEQIAAHEELSEVSASAGEPGDDVTFDIDATQLDGDVEHAVALYNADDFDGSSMTFVVDGELTTDLSAENVTIEHSIENLNGVQTIDDDLEFFDQQIEQRSSTGMTLLSDVVTFLADESGFDEPGTDATDDETLDSSSVIAVADADTELTVETYDNWTEGDYQWIHLAVGSSSDQFQSNEGTVSIETTPPDGDPTGPSPPSDDPTDPDPIEPTPSAVISIDPDPAVVGENVTFSGVESTDEDGDIVSYEWLIDNETYKGENVTKAFDTAGTYDVELTVTNSDGASDTATDTITVEDAPDDVPDDDDEVAPDDDEVAPDDDDEVAPDDDPDDADDDGIPGFGLTAAVVAFLSIALLAIRRQP